LTAVLLALGSAALFGGMTVALRLALPGLPDASGATLATVVVALAVAVAASLVRHDFHGAWPFLLTGLLAPGGSQALFTLAVREIGALAGYPVYPAYGVLVSETPPASPAPALLDRPVVDGGEGINASYAVQWALFALMGLAFPVWVRRRRQAALETDAAVEAGQPLEPVRARRPRIWDADDE